MTHDEALAALNMDDATPEIRVRTRSGAEYAVAWDILHALGQGDYVYGYRTNGACGPFSRSERNGSIRWFDLKNVTLVV